MTAHADPGTVSTTFGGRFLSANSPGLLRLVAASVIVVIAVSFVISFTALVDLAIMANIPQSVAWGWPIVVDGTMVVPTFGTILLSTRASAIQRAYPWMVLIMFGGLSIYANGIHAVGGQISAVEAFIVGAVAPLALLMSTHLLVLMLHSPLPDVSDEQIAKAYRKAQKVHPATPAAQSKPNPPARVPSTSGAMSNDDAVEAAITHWREHGHWPTGSSVGTWVGKTPKTGVRLVTKAKEQVGYVDDISSAA